MAGHVLMLTLTTPKDMKATNCICAFNRPVNKTKYNIAEHAPNTNYTSNTSNAIVPSQTEISSKLWPQRITLSCFNRKIS